MEFTGIGKIGNFVQQKNLLFAAKYRMKTGQSIVNGNGRLTLTRATMFNQVQMSKTNSNSATDKARIASIKQKLKSGKKLSAAEMNYLKEKDPTLYKKAKYADDAREELKGELKNAKTKQEAREAVMRAMAKIAADCSADFESLKGGAGGGGISFGGGDISADMSSVGSEISLDGGIESLNVEGAGNLNVEGAENLSGEISNVSTSENISAENTVATSDANANENSITNSSSTDENSDDAFDILDKYIYAIRAVQDEWTNFIKSDEYKKMPEDIFEAAENQIYGKKNFIDAILAYRKSMSYGLEK